MADAIFDLNYITRPNQPPVTATASAEECLASMDEDLPDVVLTDLAMPGADGFELIRRVRERPAERGGRVPAIALTA